MRYSRKWSQILRTKYTEEQLELFGDILQTISGYNWRQLKMNNELNREINLKSILAFTLPLYFYDGGNVTVYYRGRNLRIPSY